jgi:hypothetical protein
MYRAHPQFTSHFNFRRPPDPTLPVNCWSRHQLFLHITMSCHLRGRCHKYKLSPNFAKLPKAVYSKNSATRVNWRRYTVYRKYISTTVPEKKHALKTYGGVDLWVHVFSALSLDGIEWYAKHSSRFTRRENFPGRHQTEGFTENNLNKFIWNVYHFATMNRQSLLRSHIPRAQNWIPESTGGVFQSLL